MDGTRRVRATPVLPRCGPPCLFKGHLSTKSNAFCTDSSSLRLTTLQLVKNHMAVHYNKILSAKAAVDCSIPASMSASIKYADQQRREKLKKELARCEKESKLSKTSAQANSKNKFKSFFNTLQKPLGEPQNQDMLIEEANEFPSFAKALLPPSETQLSLRKPDRVPTNGAARNHRSCASSTDCLTSGPRSPGPGTMRGLRPRSAFPSSHRIEVVISKAASGDLLEKHADCFSNKQLPFMPRTLKTEAKSFLSQYRYYTPAKRRKDFTGPQIEAETQTELSSFNSELGTSEIKKWTDNSEVNLKQTLTTVFIICRFLERLFERHVKQNKHRLKEEKMRHLLHGLKIDLGCGSEDNSGQPKALKMLSSFEFEKATNLEQNGQDIAIQQERQQYQNALDMLLSAPKEDNEMSSSQGEFFMPVYKSKNSEEVTIQQVSDEANFEPSTWDESNLRISDSLRDRETSVHVIEGDSDTERAEPSDELSCLSPSLSQAVQLYGDSNHDKELPRLKIMEMSIENSCPLDT
ncbi:spermatogenesis-associated protein 7 [Octodon degus]|uniref:Spermatogenesis-associated protein 7 n=1 Tax=Octodon degus TaxID=10160 RepID=A0A6P6EST1_OCTDE|nr:spermatogenesis-associated protein 7 [Octodon degus]